jgi:hypothetical protein
MTVFYDRQSVVVTDQTFAIDDDFYAVYAIDGVLVNPRRVRGAVRVAAMLVPVPLATLGFAAAFGLTSFVAVAAVSAVISIAAVFTLAVTQGRPKRHELWISYDGGLRKVLETREEWRVKQLARALRRAMASNAMSTAA